MVDRDLGIVFLVFLLPHSQSGPVKRTKRNIHNDRWNHPCSANPLPVLHEIVISVLPSNVVLPDYDLRRMLSSSLSALEDTIEIVISVLALFEENIPRPSSRSTPRNHVNSNMYTTMATTREHCEGLDELIEVVFYDGFPRCTIQNLCTTDVYQLQRCYGDLQLSVISLELLIHESVNRRRIPSNDMDRLLHKIYDVLCFLLDVESVSQTSLNLTDFYLTSRGSFETIGTLNDSDFQELTYIALRGLQKLLTHAKSIIQFRISILT